MLAALITTFVLLGSHLGVNGFACTIDGLFTNPNNVGAFFQCSFGIAHLMACPSGLVWNQNKQICDWKPVEVHKQRYLIVAGSNETATGKCFDIAGGESQLHARIQLFRCHGEENQQFELNTDGTIRIMDKCLDIPDSYAVDHQYIQLFNCRSGQENQRFTIDKQNRIHVMGKCLDVPNGQIVNNNPLQLFRCHNELSQRFILVPV